MERIELKDPTATQELQAVVKRVEARFRPDKIILYGSFAYGTPRAESDFDLLVILPQPPSWRVRWNAASKIQMNRMLQLVFVKTAAFEEEKDVVGGLAYPAHQWGKILYSRKRNSARQRGPDDGFRTREQVIWDLTQGWLKSAESHLRMTEICLGIERGDYYRAGYYAEVAAENYIMAVLVWRQVPYRKSHEIQKLLGLFPEEDGPLARELSSADWLSPYGADFPDPIGPRISVETAQKAIEEARLVQSLVTARLGDYLSKGRPGGPLDSTHSKEPG